MSKESQIKELLTRSIEAVYPSREELEKVLSSERKLKIYLGIDPTGPTLHLGHAIQLEKLRLMQEMGHKIVLLIGDFTAQIGDPTGKDKTRVPLTRNQILENQKKYKKQASIFLRFKGKNKAEWKYNSKWLAKLKFNDVIGLSSNFTVQQMLERDMFQRRIESNKPISLNEFLYPLMQGYDSVALDTDIEIGGNDQTFNMLAGRTLMEKVKKKNKFVITTKLLEDASGKKMGKTEGNMVTMEDGPKDMYGKVMSWTDGMIIPAFELCTRVSMDELGVIKDELKSGVNPRDLKAKLAFEIVKVYYGEDEAKKAEEGFNKVFRDKENPDNAQLLNLEKNSENILDVIVKSKLANSKGEARRLVDQGAVKLQGETIKNWKENTDFKDNQILKVGKKGFAKIIIK